VLLWVVVLWGLWCCVGGFFVVGEVCFFFFLWAPPPPPPPPSSHVLSGLEGEVLEVYVCKSNMVKKLTPHPSHHLHPLSHAPPTSASPHTHTRTNVHTLGAIGSGGGDSRDTHSCFGQRRHG